VLGRVVGLSAIRRGPASRRSRHGNGHRSGTSIHIHHIETHGGARQTLDRDVAELHRVHVPVGQEGPGGRGGKDMGRLVENGRWLYCVPPGRYCVYTCQVEEGITDNAQSVMS
jgi:hypothetical protein